MRGVETADVSSQIDLGCQPASHIRPLLILLTPMLNSTQGEKERLLFFPSFLASLANAFINETKGKNCDFQNCRQVQEAVYLLPDCRPTL